MFRFIQAPSSNPAAIQTRLPVVMLLMHGGILFVVTVNTN